jgi:ubiquinone/menaquinone biosynthesis C-methylase UbiE
MFRIEPRGVAEVSQLDSYVLETGSAGAKRLNLQSELNAQLSYQHVARAELQEGDLVYDIGCGTGSMTEYFAHRVGPTGRVIAVDRSDAQLELAKQRIHDAGLQNVTFVCADIEHCATLDLPLADAVYGRLILMHLREPELALRRMVDVMKAGGTLLLQEAVNSTFRAEGSDELVPLVKVFMANGAARGIDYDIGARIESMAKDLGLEILDLSVNQITMEPVVGRTFLMSSFAEWGYAAFRDGLIDDDEFAKCTRIAANFERRFHYSDNYYLVARKPE